MQRQFGLSVLLLLAFCGFALSDEALRSDRDAGGLQDVEVGQMSRKLLENNVRSLAKDGNAQVQVKKGKEKVKAPQLGSAGKVKPKAAEDASAQQKKAEETGKGGFVKVDPSSAGKFKNKKKVVEEDEDEDLQFIEEERLTTGSLGKKDVKEAQQKVKVKPEGKKKTRDLEKREQNLGRTEGGVAGEKLREEQLKDEPEQLKDDLDGEKQPKDDLDDANQAKDNSDGEEQVTDGLDAEQNMQRVFEGEVKAQNHLADDEKIEVEPIQDDEELPVDKADATVLPDRRDVVADDRELEATERGEEVAEQQVEDADLTEKVVKMTGTGRPEKKAVPSKRTFPKKDTTKTKSAKGRIDDAAREEKTGDAEVESNAGIRKKKPTAKATKPMGKKKGKELDNIKMGTDKSKESKGTKDMPINFGAEDAEDLQTDAGLPTKSSSTGVLMGDEVKDEDEDEDINLLDEFSALPSKLQQTAGHVADTLRPGFERISEKSKGYFTHANKQMTESLTPLMGEQVAPIAASLISYALLLVPLILVLYMLERIRASLSLAKVLFFVNLYLGAYFLTLVLATFALHGEPMAFFFKNARSSYIFLQLLQAFGYCFYFLLYSAVFVKSCSGEGILMRILAGFQLLVVAFFGLHYYVTVFHRAMAVKIPRTSWKVYLVYSGVFAVLCLVARAKIERLKKEYYYTPTDDPDEAVPVDKRS